MSDAQPGARTLSRFFADAVRAAPDHAFLVHDGGSLSYREVDRLSDQAAALKVEPGLPALVIRRWYSGENGRVFEVAFSRYPMGRFAYRNVLVSRGK